ncbi:alcohol dehydrogenase catalytic domain-containing protein [Oxyplasma meridianum]|uniref:Alcohol dehydrogenase catalytic domain-containing protein n=1 Tax=Oxyplasma meridianum TaxID=3073602 RepID=A0AAX4NE56_9ARCH
MKAIVVRPPSVGAEIGDIEIKTEKFHGLSVKILENGICGTDREIVKGMMGEASSPPGDRFMVLGHEALGILEEDGFQKY